MEKLFNSEENNIIKQRINKLTALSQPLWGKMNVTQMLAHMQIPMQVAFGHLQLKGGLMGFLFGKMAKKQLVNEKPFKKNSPTMKEFKTAGNNFSEQDFERERDKVLSYVDRFVTEGSKVIANKKHPFFGVLTIEEWDMLQWKHLDHHLRQFGV